MALSSIRIGILGNVVDGTIGRQLVDTLIESSHNVGLILRFFNMFLRLKDITSSERFTEYDPENKGIVSRRDFQRAMVASKVYTRYSAEITVIIYYKSVFVVNRATDLTNL